MPSLQPRLRLYDLLEPAASLLPPVRGRAVQFEQLARSLTRHTKTNLILKGPSGVGKSTLVRGFMQEIVSGNFAQVRPLPYLELDTEALAARLLDPQRRDEVIAHSAAAFATLPPCVLVIDNADDVLPRLDQPGQVATLFKVFIECPDHHVVLVMREETFQAQSELLVPIKKFFEVVTLTPLTEAECLTVLLDYAPLLSGRYHIQIERRALEVALEQCQRGQPDAVIPQAALHLLDEAAAACRLEQAPILTEAHIQHVAAQRTGMPTPQVSTTNRAVLRELGPRLAQHVRGQEAAVGAVATTIQRAWLGLKNPRRPLGSFLFMGPSGVGKTELAKALAREVYGSDKAFIRIDMSEFGEPHGVARLIGAPPGYVGHEAGGQLTNPVQQQPFSLILLDEIEKAHPTIFDIFLQVLEDGRLTDGRGVTVDFTKTIIIATSNIGINEIVEAHERGVSLESRSFVKHTLLPLLLQRFRTEFLNRFEGIHVFSPLSEEILLDIARLEIAKIEERLQAHHIQIDVSDRVLTAKIQELYNPRFGARPIKRFIEETLETAVAERLLTT
jgi:ATP-dependent Clp protease ATP-binding subunit ClpC